MSDRYENSASSASDGELDAILQAADTDLASALEQVTDTAAGFQAIIFTASLQGPPAPLSDGELDAILQGADTDLASALEQVTDTAAGSRAVVAEAIAEAMRAHPACRSVANGA
jgi:hypothetical protein